MNSKLLTAFSLVISGFFVQSGVLSAQSKVNLFEGSLSYMIPSGAFGDHITSNKIGFELAFLRQIDYEKPFFWGVSAGYFNIGHYNAVTQEIVDFTVYEFNSTTNSNLWGFDGKIRYYPNLNLGPLELYLEALIGFKWLYTFTRKTLVYDEDNSSNAFNEGQIALSYGFNAGIQAKLAQDIYLSFKGGFYPGLSVPYYALKKNNITIYTTLDAFELKRSTTDIMRFDLGVTYRF